MSQPLVAAHRMPVSGTVHGFVRMLAGLRSRLGEWAKRQRERAELARLGARELQDLGISPAQAMFEHGKPFWRE